MQVVEELIRQLRSRGLLSSMQLQSLREMGFDVHDGPTGAGRHRQWDLWDDDDWIDDFEESFEHPLHTGDWSLEDAALDPEELEDARGRPRRVTRSPEHRQDREDRLRSAIASHEWPAELLELVGEVASALDATVRADPSVDRDATVHADAVERVVDADQDALDRSLRSLAVAYPGALVGVWQRLRTDPTPAGLEPGTGPAAGLFEVLIEADRDVSTSLRYRSLLAEDPVRHAVRLVGAHRRLFASFGRVIVGLGDREMGWQLNFNTDPLLYEVAVILYTANRPPLTVGDLRERADVELPLRSHLPAAPFEHGWQYAAEMDPVGVVALLQRCRRCWDDEDPLDAGIDTATAGSVVVRIEPGLRGGPGPAHMLNLTFQDVTCWWDAQGVQRPRVVGITWTDSRWWRVELTGPAGDADDPCRGWLQVDGGPPIEVVGDAELPMAALHELPSKRSLTARFSVQAHASPSAPRTVHTVTLRRAPVYNLNQWGGGPAPWDAGSQLGVGLHHFPVLHCGPGWHRPAEG